jgi:hypothetical protein
MRQVSHPDTTSSWRRAETAAQQCRPRCCRQLFVDRDSGWARSTRPWRHVDLPAGAIGVPGMGEVLVRTDRAILPSNGQDPHWGVPVFVSWMPSSGGALACKRLDRPGDSCPDASANPGPEAPSVNLIETGRDVGVQQ